MANGTRRAALLMKKIDQFLLANVDARRETRILLLIVTLVVTGRCAIIEDTLLPLPPPQTETGREERGDILPLIAVAVAAAVIGRCATLEDIVLLLVLLLPQTKIGEENQIQRDTILKDILLLPPQTEN